MFNVRLAGGHLYGKQLFTWLSLVVSLIKSFVLSFFPLDVLDEIWDLTESVSEGFLTYSCIGVLEHSNAAFGYMPLLGHCDLFLIVIDMSYLGLHFRDLNYFWITVYSDNAADILLHGRINHIIIALVKVISFKSRLIVF